MAGHPGARGVGAAAGTVARQHLQAREGPRRGSALGFFPGRGRAGSVERVTVGGASASLGLPSPGLLALGSCGQHAATDRCGAHVGPGQDQRALLKEHTGC